MGEFNQYLKKFLASQKAKEIKEELTNKRKLLALENNSPIFIKINVDAMLNKEELEELVEEILAMEMIPPEYRVRNDNTSLFLTKPRLDLVYHYTELYVNWCFHLQNCVQEEDFELASKVRDVMEIESRYFLEDMKEYCIDFEEEDIELLAQVREHSKKAFNL